MRREVVNYAGNVEISLARPSRNIPDHLYSILKHRDDLRAGDLYLEDKVCKC